jgi:septum formation protein
MEHRRIILGSTSPFRQAILNNRGVLFEVVSPPVDEKKFMGHDPKSTARYRAEAKAFSVAEHVRPHSLVIGADQVLGFEGEVFDKANNAQEAFLKLKRFSGKTHYLHSAVSVYEVLDTGAIRRVFSRVWDVPMVMRSLQDQEIESYIATGEWKGVVGCYRYEGQGRRLFNFEWGVLPEQSSVIGLPEESIDLMYGYI